MTRVFLVFFGMLLGGMVLFCAVDWYHPIANPEACGRAWGLLTFWVTLGTAVYEVRRYMAKVWPAAKDPPLPWATATSTPPAGHRVASDPAPVPPVSPAQQAGPVRPALGAHPR